MADVVADQAVEVDSSPKRRGGARQTTRTVVKKAIHPPTSQMVISAIDSLKESGGSSLQAIKKYITITYKVNSERISFHIRKYLKSAVLSGKLVQTKGKGASGSFKLSTGQARQKSAKDTVKTGKQRLSKSKAKKLARSKKTKKLPTTPKVPKPKKGKPATEKQKSTATPQLQRRSTRRN